MYSVDTRKEESSDGLPGRTANADGISGQRSA